MENLYPVIQSIGLSVMQMWPYFLLTIPLAVAAQLSGASRYITQALQKRPLMAILLATLVGAFSPFCSCGVVPLIASLLLGGIPLPPVMAFWIASPSMDPELIPLSIAVIGLELTLWRVIATLLISLLAGYLTLIAVRTTWLGKDFLKMQQSCCATTCCPAVSRKSFRHRLWRETRTASLMTLKFMLLAFVIQAGVEVLIPANWISISLGADNTWSVFWAALIGIPAYTSNITALPLVGALLEQGIHRGAALSFLVAGPVTTLPAMVAVWGLVKPRVFAIYLLVSLLGALAAGLLFQFFHTMLGLW